MDYMEDELELEEVSVDQIPTFSGFYIGHIDNFGNLKTTIKQEDFKGKYEYGDTVNVRINSVSKQAKYVTNLFGGTPGELVVYPGSSGSPDNRFMEITVWRHFTEEKPTTGREEFNNPKVGSLIELL
jgi:S-adenosylmethionine hydrolase